MHVSFVAERIADIYKSILPLNVPYNLLEGTGRKEFELGKLHFMSVLLNFYIRGPRGKHGCMEYTLFSAKICVYSNDDLFR
jgi:hypothetical protein